jgi:hypothetical protein
VGCFLVCGWEAVLAADGLVIVSTFFFCLWASFSSSIYKTDLLSDCFKKV